jgi:hypothetical protein
MYWYLPIVLQRVLCYHVHSVACVDDSCWASSCFSPMVDVFLQPKFMHSHTLFTGHVDIATGSQVETLDSTPYFI